MQQKQKISASLRQSVWLAWVGKQYDARCTIKWCKSIITPFTFEVGHNVPESRGGSTTLENLRPICAICNKSMGNRYTIDEYSRLHARQADKEKPSFLRCCISSGVKHEDGHE